MRVYVSGPMTNMPAFNFPAFHAAAASLRASGYEVVNPAEFDESDPTPKEWHQYLRRDIKELADCDGIAMLSGWERSKGARLEKHIAEELGMRVIFINQALVKDARTSALTLVPILALDINPEARPGLGRNTLSKNMENATEEQIAAVSTAPRITSADIAANIVSEHYFTAKQGVLGEIADGGTGGDYDPHWEQPKSHQALGLLTFCVLVLRNGFTVTGESACASPENFNAEIGRRIARENAVSKVWPLMGYALKTQLMPLDQRPQFSAFAAQPA